MPCEFLINGSNVARPGRLCDDRSVRRASRRTIRATLRRGFTLIELLVVIAILGALVGLLLPAIGSAREAARKIHCANNLKQIALATSAYEAAHRRLPAAGLFAPQHEAVYYDYSYVRVRLRSGTNQSWLVRLLPHMELSSLHDRFDLARHVSDNPDEPQAEQPSSLLCPSEEALGRLFLFEPDGQGRTARFGKSNYAAYSSPYHTDDFHHQGAIWAYGIQLRNVVDGASNTLAFSEIRTRDHEHDQRGAWALPWSGASLLAFDMHPARYAPNLDAASQEYAANSLSLGYTQLPNSAQPDVLYACPDLAGEQLDSMPCADTHFGYISAAPRSRHPGGVNAAFLDGSVRFIEENVDEVTMAYQVSIDDEQSEFGIAPQ